MHSVRACLRAWRTLHRKAGWDEGAQHAIRRRGDPHSAFCGVWRSPQFTVILNLINISHIVSLFFKCFVPHFRVTAGSYACLPITDVFCRVLQCSFQSSCISLTDEQTYLNEVACCVLRVGASLWVCCSESFPNKLDFTLIAHIRAVLCHTSQFLSNALPSTATKTTGNFFNLTAPFDGAEIFTYCLRRIRAR